MTADVPEFDPELPILGEIELRLRERAARPAPEAAADAHAAPRPRGRRARTGSPSYRPSACGRADDGAAPNGPGERRGAENADERGDGHDAQPRERDERRGRRERGAGRRRRAGVVARRSSVLVALGLLVGASALATRSIVGDDGDGDPSLHTTAPARLAADRIDGERWTLSAARRGDDVCDAFLVTGAVATRCDSAPARGEVMLDGVLSPRARYVVGFAGANVRTVVVAAGPARQVVAARAVRSGPAVRRARLPQTLRWFVARLPRSPRPGFEPPARVTARDRAGRALGAAQISCSVGRATAACRRAAAPR